MRDPDPTPAPDAPETDKTPAARLAVLGGDPACALAPLLRRGGAAVADAEPGPKQASAALLTRFHYGLASVRAGRLGDVRLIAQLIEDARGPDPFAAEPVFWPQPDGTLVDAARPEVDPAGLPDPDTATAYRRAHLAALRQLIAESDRLVLPLAPGALLTDPASGRVFPRPPAGITAPDWPEARTNARDLDAGFARLLAGVQALKPGLSLQLIVLPAPPGARAETRTAQALLSARAADWSRETARVHHDPVLDALAARLCALPESSADHDRLAALVAQLCGGADLLDLLGGGPLPPAPAAEHRRPRKKDPERRAKRKARAEAKGKAAKVMCEDELLEAFSK